MERQGKEGAAIPSSTADLEAVCRLIGAKWHWPSVTDRQRALITALANQHGIGSAGYARVIALLSDSTEADPLKILKAESARLREIGKQRADAQEAESTRWTSPPAGRSGGMTTLGEILTEMTGGVAERGD